ncbi:SLBB domain-containing protein [Psychrosphaera ytuae]|uniref:SLBB domain-containing protein n=1 Tax=Psychrosphaera ytuae TaxID=2820710 RepID=A0A975HIU9_9GAMM|nr:SLBB domain-containing protein [Psychrosphaera ytuae]QTH64632.1 SLBB domain-containing protein [Psychrosphaera ytuae]
MYRAFLKGVLSVTAVLTLTCAPLVTAQISTTPSAAQIEQFKKLPKAQQQALAKQFGIDLNALESSPSNTTNTQVKPEQQYLNSNATAVDDALLSQAIEMRQKNVNELRPFGYEMFKGMQGAFVPSGTASVPADYVIGPGDSLEINLYGKQSSSQVVTVDSEGKITFAELPPLNVVGLTYSEVKQRIAEVVEVSMIGIKSSVSIAGLRNIQVYVVGDVKNPGAYQLSSLSTMTNALFISGGPTEVGSLRNVELKRAGKTISKLDLYKLFTQGDVSADQRLQEGDVVFVNAINAQVQVYGEVRRPAIYELSDNTKISDLIELAGGLTSLAYPKNILVTTLDNNYQREVRRLDLTQKQFDYVAKAGDIIRVLPISQQFSKVVHVGGAVSRPSSYAFYDGMTLSELIKSKDDLSPSTDMNYALVVSELSEGGIELQQFKPKALFTQNSLQLKANDIVLFFNKYDESDFRSANLSKRQYFNDKLNDIPDLTTNEKIDLANSAKEQATSLLANQWLKQNVNALQSESGLNYLYKLKTGDLQAQQEALASTKSLSRQDLIVPVIKLLEANVLPGHLVATVEVTGEVHFPGVYPISESATIVDIISAAGGVTESANMELAEISRTLYQAKDASKEHIQFSISAALNDEGHNNLALQPKDVVNVFQQANWQKESKITIAGEVAYPGTYTIREGEGLAAVLERAGGLTQFAAPQAAFFTRVSLKEMEQRQARDLARNLSKELAFKSISSSYGSVAVGEVQTLVNQLTTVEGVGRLVIDLNKVINETTYDIQLEDGDKLMVPTYRREVNVIGEVQVATSHVHNESWNLEDYLQSSGGLRQQADEDRVYVIRANGLVEVPDYTWLGVNETRINPGDTIVVPLDANYTDRLTLWEKATSIFYQLTVGLAALGRL